MNLPFRILIFVIFFFGLLLFSTNSLHGQYFPAKVYKDTEGLLSNRIQNITQYVNKEIWFSTENGLAIYDGLEWKSLPDSLDFVPRNGQMKIKMRSDSSCYLIGLNEGKVVMVRKTPSRWYPISLPEPFRGKGAHVLYNLDDNPDYPGVVLSYEDNVLIYHEKNGWKNLQVKDPDNKKLIIYYAQIRNDTLTLASSKGLYQYNWQKNYAEPIYKGKEVFRFLFDPFTNRTYLLGQGWLGYYRDGSVTHLIQEETIGFDVAFGSAKLIVRRNLIYYSSNSPLYSYNISTGERQMILSESFDKDYTCVDALLDHENNLWVVTMRGGFKIYNRSTYYYDKTQLLEDEVTAILEASNGDIFLGANQGFQILKPNGDIRKYTFESTYFHPRVMDIVEYRGAVYLAANSIGVVKYTKGQLNYFPIADHDNNAIDLEVYDGKLYAANRDELHLLKNDQWEQVYRIAPTGYVNSFIRKIFFNDQYQYLLTVNGIQDLQNGAFITSQDPETSSIYFAAVYNDSVMLATKNGLATIEDDRIRLLRTDQPHSSYSLLVDQKNQLWVGTEEGVYKYNQKPHVHLSKDNGLIGNEVNRNAFIQTRDGRIFVGTDEGMSVLSEDEYFSYPSPSAEITGMLLNGQQTSKSEFDHNENNITFEYRAISYYNEDIINYRVKLLGFDKDWQYLPLSAQRRVVYRNLQPDSYQLQVQARVGQGNWGPVAYSSPVSIHRAFYNRAWFRIVCVILFGFMIFILLKYRNHSLNKRNTILRERVTEKTNELNKQNNQLLKTISELKTAQGQLIQSEKLASMGLLTAGIAHEMNNPLNYIRGGAECLKKNLREIHDLHKKMMKTNGESLEKTAKEYEYLIKESDQLIKSILDGAEKSTSIVKSLGSFTSDSQTFFSFVDLQQEVEAALTLMSNQIGFRITVNKMYSSIPKIECYPARINQLIVNILLNAVQAIKDEGEITIRIHRKGDEHIGLEVSDNGEGIRLNNYQRVFEPFFTTKDKNPGLGLTIVRSIIQDHEGDVVFLSKKGVGSKIKIKLPIHQTFHPELL